MKILVILIILSVTAPVIIYFNSLFHNQWTKAKQKRERMKWVIEFVCGSEIDCGLSSSSPCLLELWVMGGTSRQCSAMKRRRQERELGLFSSFFLLRSFIFYFHSIQRFGMKLKRWGGCLSFNKSTPTKLSIFFSTPKKMKFCGLIVGYKRRAGFVRSWLRAAASRNGRRQIIKEIKDCETLR